MSAQTDNVLRLVEQQDIAFIRLWFTDIFGSLKTVMMSPAELESAFEEGVGFDGSSIEGFSRISESDTLLRPDPSTYQPLPFDEDSGYQTARMFCDITMPDGDPLYADPRQVLRRQVSAARDMGFEFMASPEIEFYVVKPGDGDQPPTPRTRAATSTKPSATRRRGCAAKPCPRWSTWALSPNSPTTRAHRASRKSICATPTR